MDIEKDNFCTECKLHKVNYVYKYDCMRRSGRKTSKLFYKVSLQTALLRSSTHLRSSPQFLLATNVSHPFSVHPEQAAKPELASCSVYTAHRMLHEEVSRTVVDKRKKIMQLAPQEKEKEKEKAGDDDKLKKVA